MYVVSLPILALLSLPPSTLRPPGPTERATVGRIVDVEEEDNDGGTRDADAEEERMRNPPASGGAIVIGDVAFVSIVDCDDDVVKGTFVRRVLATGILLVVVC
jgi:hypothetical protein